MRYMLDTNIVSDIVRNPRGMSAGQFRRIGQSNIGISIVVASELRYGITRQSSALSRNIAEMLNRLLIVAFEEPADAHYGKIRAHLESVGKAIGYNDTFIAAHARALDCVLVTDNEREFSRVPGLNIENWLR